MVLFVTIATNDDDLAGVLGGSVVRCPVLTDVAFWGVGEHGTLKIAVERKKVGDIAACVNDGRYLYQAQIAKEDGFDVLVLIAEVGEIRSNPDDGLLEMKVWGINPRTLHRAEVWQPVRPTITYSRFDQYLTELDYLAGIIVKRSANVQETAAIIKALWVNFQTAPGKHNSLHQIYEQPSRVQLVRPGLVQRVAKEFSGVGYERSRLVSEHFKSVRQMVNAPASEWRKVDGIGKKIADRIVAELG